MKGGLVLMGLLAAAGVAAAASGKKKEPKTPGGTAPVGSAEPAFLVTLLALLNQDTQAVSNQVNVFRQRGDDMTAGALEAQLGRMQAAMVGQPLPPVNTLSLDGNKGPALNEWAGTLFTLEGRPSALNQWAAAFRTANMPQTAAALEAKARSAQAPLGSPPAAPSTNGGTSGGTVFQPPPPPPPPGLPSLPPPPPPPPPPPAGSPQISPQLQTQIAQTLASGSAATMRQLADFLQAQGFVVQAEQLRARAAEIELAARTSTPPPPPPPPAGLPPVATIPPALQQAINAAVTPTAMRAAADQLDALGFRAEANALRMQAAVLESSQRPAPLPTAPAPLPPPIAIPGITVPVDPRRQLAQDTVNDLLRNPKQGITGNPNAMLKLFQKQEALTADGLYGPKSALAIAAYGIIPPIPRQYHTATKAKDKEAYKAKILEFAAADPARRAEWLEAAKV